MKTTLNLFLNDRVDSDAAGGRGGGRKERNLHGGKAFRENPHKDKNTEDRCLRPTSTLNIKHCLTHQGEDKPCLPMFKN